MANSMSTKIKKVISYFLVLLLIAGVSYVLVYKASFLPKGYIIVSQQSNSLSLKSYNVIGVSQGALTLAFSDDNVWKKDEIVYQVKRYKDFLWVMMTFAVFSLFLLVSKVRQGVKWGRAIFDSNIIFALLLPGTQLFFILSTMDDLLS